jgi:hypothetical protein
MSKHELLSEALEKLRIEHPNWSPEKRLWLAEQVLGITPYWRRG